jgi:hypothetical protein
MGKDIDLWKEQTAKVYEAVEDRLTFSDTPPVMREDWYK